MASLDELLTTITDAEADLVQHLDSMGDGPEGDPARPSALPGWTRGHVLTHMARNADGIAHVLREAEQGETAAQYPGGMAQRNGDIERGRTRPWAEQVADLRTSSATLASVLAAQTRWDVVGIAGNGDQVPADAFPRRRLVEVLVHHVDLGDAGYTAADWPDGFVRDELRRREMQWNARRPMGATGLPPAALDAPELTRLLWLLGRAQIHGLGPAGLLG
ncbi:maleylpyruvate isomerase family mycothiol-dependent enzyme [soil metagenome]